MKLLIRLLVASLVIHILFGCVTQKKCLRKFAIERVDTLVVRDTVEVPSTTANGSVLIEHIMNMDTVYVTQIDTVLKDTIITRIVYKKGKDEGKDYLELQSKTAPKTIYIENKVPVATTILQKPTFWYMIKQLWWLLLVGFALGILYKR